METEDIVTCKGCGVLLNFSIGFKLSKYDTGYRTHVYTRECPVCKAEVYDER